LDGIVPDDNLFVAQANAYHCAMQVGQVPEEVGPGEIYAEKFAYGLRNPMHVAVGPSESNETQFIISHVAFVTWEELDPAGTDYAGVDDGFPEREGPWAFHSACYSWESDSNVVDPIHFYQHYKYGTSGSAAVAATAFVPK
jgi:hypothetical protein